jgi:trans-aconitate methyltransferase
MTLVDRSAEMLAVSRLLNPECEHIQGDMCNLALQREFDGVFIHDAIVYLTTPQELRQALETAFLHCRTNGIVVVAPDYIRETFVEATTHGGHDGPNRAARYLSWTYDPDPQDTTYVSDMVYTLRTAPDQIEVVYDRHVEGLFPLQLWLSLLSEVGFDPKVITDPFERQIFIGIKSTLEN